MRVRLRIDGRRPRRWHAALIARLAARPGLSIEVEDRPGPDDAPAYAEALFRIESLAYGVPRDGPASRLDPAAAAAWPRPAGDLPAGDLPDLVIDLVGDVPERAGVPVRRLHYDGLPGEAALFGALLAKRVPVASLVEGGRTLCAARLGTEVRGVMLTMLDDALVRTATMIEAGFAGGAAPLADPDAAAAPQVGLPPVALTATELARRTLRIAARAVFQRLYRLGYRSPHWRIGWRRLDGPDLVDLRAHPETGWQELPDDGRRFYADPFPILHDGRCWLFVEEFPHATGKGVISAVPFDAEGPAGIPAPVLETEHHLSYPFVFERDGAVWMIPESCAAGSIDLYRATAFPGGWVREARLVSGVAASDPTLFEHGGRWWMFATVRGAPASEPLGRGSYSDALHLWSAPDFRGPWTAHRANPVLIDAATARPAGRIVVRNGQAIRPVQDCADGYGRALGLMRIDRLDEDGFAQSLHARITSGPLWPGTRIHSLNCAGGFEFIDGSARIPRFLPPGLARRQV
nr:formyl transferase [Methylobacterium nonmethylotrophicum]